jgi:hypothetical protein
VREEQKPAPVQTNDERQAEYNVVSTLNRIVDAAEKVPGVDGAAIRLDESSCTLNVSVFVSRGFEAHGVLESVSRAAFDFKPIGYRVAVTRAEIP